MRGVCEKGVASSRAPLGGSGPLAGAAPRVPLTLPGSPQVNLGYLCQACTSLLHSRKMLQHYLQVTQAPAAAHPGWPRPNSSAHQLSVVSPLPARTKMGRASPRPSAPELSGRPQLPRLPPPAPPPSSLLPTQRPQSSGPCAPSSTAS